MGEATAVVSNDGTASLIRLDDGHEARYSAKWLRFHCQCVVCKPAFSGMYPVDRTKFDDKITIESIAIDGNELRCTFVNDLESNHVTVMTLAYLKLNCNCDSCLRKEIAIRHVNHLHSKSDVPSIDYDTAMTDQGLFRCMEKIMASGFCVVTNAPFETKEEYVNFVQKFGPIWHSMYGYVWEVKNETNPINAAYTTMKLPSHQDIPVYETAPGVQVLYTLRFDDTVRGGESKMVDILMCAEILREKHPADFQTMCRVPATFATIDFKREHPAWYEHRKPHIEVDYYGEIVSVNWHPSLEGTLRIKEIDMEAYYRAYKTFMNIVHDADNQMVFRLAKGDFMIFNNHRIAHAREAYSTGSHGKRHLLGCYTDIEDVKSNYFALADKLKCVASPKKLGNRSSF